MKSMDIQKFWRENKFFSILTICAVLIIVALYILMKDSTTRFTFIMPVIVAYIFILIFTQVEDEKPNDK